MGTLMGKNIYPIGKWVWVRLGTTHTRLPVGKINPKAHIHMQLRMKYSCIFWLSLNM
jgi:hypothetical protein